MSIEPIHKEPSPLAGKTVMIKAGAFKGQAYRVEDWWDRLGQGSWGVGNGNMACLDYAVRSGKEFAEKEMEQEDVVGGSRVNEVLYGKIGCVGKIIHVSQIGEERSMMTERQACLAGKLAEAAERVVHEAGARHGRYTTTMPIEEALTLLRAALREYNKEMGV